MTRFARAKGSKASNERLPNEATPWCVMKQQWADNSAMKNNPPEKTKSAKELLSAKDDPFYSDTTGNVNTDWAEFEPREASKHVAKQKARSNSNKASENLARKLDNPSAENGNSSMQNSNSGSVSPKKSKKQKSIAQHEESEKSTKEVGSTPAENGNSSMHNSNGNSVSPKKSKKQKFMAQHEESVTECVTENETKVEATQAIKQKSAKKKKKQIDSLDSPVVENTNVELAREADEEPARKKNKRHSSASSIVESKTNLESVCEENQEPVKKKKKKDKKINSSADPVVENTTNEESAQNTGCETAKKKKKQKDKKMEDPAAETCAATTESLDANQETTEKKSSLIVSKRHKRNQKRIAKNALIAAAAAGVEKSPGEAASSGGFDAAGNDWSSNVNFGKRQKFGTENAENRGASGTNDFKRPPMNRNGEANNATKRKAPKIRDDKEHKRRKPVNDSMKCVINGMELEIVMFDGFPVKKEDAERLKDLRKQMVMKGIPKSEIDGAMKLERRRAEKVLARVRRQVCFHCRKAGHNLSECPEVGEDESATGICFKCGSTEHTHFECKVTKKEEFRFASCFICREQGHIAKQCPDNPKGLYPQGGACKICGDVTHLRKDCPDLTQEKEESTLTLSTITGDTLESLDEDVTKKVAGEDSKKAKGKIVKF